MQKKGMTILVIVAVLIVVGILGFVHYDNGLEVTSIAPGTQNPTLEAGTATSTDTTASGADATATTTSDQTQASMNTETTTPDGLKIDVLAEGSGTAAKAGDNVTVNYTGSLSDGTVFDSNVDPKFNHVQPFSFVLGAHQVIAGWDEGVAGMKVGEKRRLTIPASLGYGAAGAGGGAIPPNATLMFDVQVVSIAPGN